MDKLVDLQGARLFLRSLGLTTDEGVIRQVVVALPRILRQEPGVSLYQFYHGRGEKSPILGKGTADKIKELYIAGKLRPYVDYLAGQGQSEIDEDKLIVGAPALTYYYGLDRTDGPAVGHYATLTVEAVSKADAMNCSAWVTMLTPPGRSLPLHWAGMPMTPGRSEVPHFDISPTIPARLDVAFALPPPGGPEAKYEPAANSSGLIAMVVWPFGEARGSFGQELWRGEGCWLAQPEALFNPHPRSEGYLAPGEHRIRVRIRYSNRGEWSGDFLLVSPQRWDALQLRPV
jgi:hypothetical protein